MADSVILSIKSWRVSDTTGRKHLLEISPQFPSNTDYFYEEHLIDEDDTFTITGGKLFTYIWADKAIDYQINSGVTMNGQLVMLTNKTTNSTYTIKITGVTDVTKVSVTLVS
jgi:hypothetical protein